MSASLCHQSTQCWPEEQMNEVAEKNMNAPAPWTPTYPVELLDFQPVNSRHQCGALIWHCSRSASNYMSHLMDH